MFFWFRFNILIVLSALLVYSAEAGVVDLSKENFDDVVDGSNHVFVKFYAPWCGHCKNLAPDYEIVGETFKTGDNVIIAKVDADEEQEIGGRFGIQGFPTLKYFPKGESNSKGEDYEGQRSADAIVSFMNGKAGTARKVHKPPSAVTILSNSNFEAIVKDPTKFVLVEFYAPWCGHCKSLAPIYEKLAQVYEGEESVVIANLDATEHRDIGQSYDVSGFPTIKYFPQDDKAGMTYESGRSLDNFVTFINEKTGLARSTDGGLLPNAGLVSSLDNTVKTFTKWGDKDASNNLKLVIEAAAKVSDEDSENAQTYIRVFKKIESKGEGYLTTEAIRLKKMLDGGSISAKQKSMFQYKLNILNRINQIKNGESLDVTEEL